MRHFDVHPLSKNETLALAQLLHGALYGKQILDAVCERPGSSHYQMLTGLERLGLVTAEEDGRRVMYAITDLGVSVYQSWIDYVLAWHPPEGEIA